MAEPIAARLALVILVASACARPQAGPAAKVHRSAPAIGGALRTPGLGAPVDPTVMGARLIPASLEEAHVWGIAPGGGIRQIVAGLRVVSSPTGDLRAATDRLPGNPSTVCELPERLGGGFLMALGPHLWEAKTWLGSAAPIFTMPAPIADVFVGLDRVYLRYSQGPLVAIDPRTGSILDLGPLPASPRVASIAALDAWRAVATADLRGAVVTLDAGSSWRPVALPVEPLRTLATGDAFAVGGLDRSRTMRWWAVLADGQTGWLANPILASGPPTPNVARSANRADALPTPLGPRPLLAAVEDGWPLTDGTALVARDGALVRVRLADGAIVETQPDAFALKPARCHPLSLARAGDPSAFGFVCGEARSATAVFRWDAPGARLVELRRFDSPREVLSSGSGALAVRGPCGPHSDPGSDAAGGDAAVRDREDWCLMAPDGDWSELHFSGPAVERARIVVLSNRRVALVRPPEAGDLSSARLTLIDGVTDDARATHLPLRIEPVAAEVARALRWGTWMDGFEERRPGILGGWVDCAGSILGVEITLDGELRVGEYIRDAGSPVASGRWAFGWTASRGGFETTDGGMTWTKEIALPDPIAEPRLGREAHCGPIGCLTAGWLRIGWGATADPAPVEPPRPQPRPIRRPPGLTLDCEPLGMAPLADAPPPGLTRGIPVAAATARPSGRPRGLSGSPSAAAPSELRPFYGRAGPTVASGERGLSIDAMHPLERSLRTRPLARAYVWGPSATDWQPSGRWQVRWLWPWQEGTGPDAEERSSAVAPAPWANLEQASRALTSTVVPAEWAFVPGDDPDHALLVEHRAGFVGSVSTTPGTVALAIVEADRAPAEVRRVDGGLLPDLQGAVRSAGHWYLATAQLGGEPPSTIVWLVDGSVARELGRLPRVATESVAPGRLVRWLPGAGSGAPSPLAVLVTAPDSEHGAMLWVSSFDPETGVFGDPEPLAPGDLSDRTVAICSGDDSGWEFEASYPGTVDVRVGPVWGTRLQGTLARLRLSRTAACVDALFASADPQATHGDGMPFAARAQGAMVGARSVGATVLSERGRARLRCRISSP